MAAATRGGGEAAAAAGRMLAAGGAYGRLGIVLGSGLGGLAERLDARRDLPASASGWLPAGSALGHAGRIVFGTIDGCPAVVLQGRVHAYEGFDDDCLSRGVALLAALGVRLLVVTSAAGGLRPDMTEGEILVIDDHLDLARRAAGESAGGGVEAAGGRAMPARQTVDPSADGLVAAAVKAARGAGVPARSGVYARLLGPSYETRAEYRFLRRAGADAVGMSTVPEIRAAARLGIGCVALSVITNVARPDAPGRTDGDDVCRVAAGAAEGVWGVIEAMARRVGSESGAPSADRKEPTR